MWSNMLKTLNPVSYGVYRMERLAVIYLAPVLLHFYAVEHFSMTSSSSLVYQEKINFFRSC